jgi:hypothetical protein
VVGEPNEVLLVVADPGLSTAPSDAAVADRLASMGFEVNVVDDNGIRANVAFGQKLILISSTVNSGNIGDTFKSSEVPVLIWEEANQDDFAMTTDEPDFTRGLSEAGTELELTLPDHPLSAGFSAGTLSVLNSPEPMGWGYPGQDAIIIASAPGEPDQSVLYGYDTGGEMMGGFLAPARRVLFFLTDDAFNALNADGLKLFDAAVGWAADADLSIDAPGSDIHISISSDGSQLTLSWDGASGPVSLQSKKSLSESQWEHVETTSEHSMIVPIEAGKAFFRIIQ